MGYNPVTMVTRNCDQPIKSEPSSSYGGSPTTSRHARIRRPGDFLNELSRLSDNLGDPQQKHHILMHGDNGITGVLKGIPIHF